MRESIWFMLLRNPSAVCTYDCAFWTLVLAAMRRAFCASSFSDTARPAASSDGLTIFEPELKRASERLSIAFDSFKLRVALMALILVLMTMVVFQRGVD